MLYVGICKQNRQLLESELQRQHNFALGKDASSFDVHFHLQEWNRMEGMFYRDLIFLQFVSVTHHFVYMAAITTNIR